MKLFQFYISLPVDWYDGSLFSCHCFAQVDVELLDNVDLYIENRTKQDQSRRVQPAVVIRADATQTPVVQDDKQRFPSDLLRHLLVHTTSLSCRPNVFQIASTLGLIANFNVTELWSLVQSKIVVRNLSAKFCCCLVLQRHSFQASFF